MSLNLLGKRKFSDINSDEYDTLSYSVLCCNQCRNSLIVRRYANDTYAPICSLEPHCKRCKHYVDCSEERCPICCQPESGEPVPSFSELVSAGVMCVKILELPLSEPEPAPAPSSAEPCTAMVVAGSASVEPVVSSGEPCTDMVVAGSASAEPSMTMLGVRTSSRRVHLKPCKISFNKQGFFQMVDIYNKFVARVHDKLFSGDAAAGDDPKFTVQELHKLKTEYDKGAAWTSEEVQELCALPLIMLKAQWKDEHQLSTFRDQLTKLMEYISGLQQESGKHGHDIAALRQAMAELDRVDAGSLLADADSVSAAGGASSASFVANSSTVAIINKNFKQASNERNELKTRISTLDRALKPRIADLQEQIHKLVQGTGAARLCAVDLDTRLKVVETAAGASGTDFDARLKKLEAGPGYTRDEIKKIQAEYVVNAPMTDKERGEWDQQPLILRKFQWRVNYNNECILKRVAKVDQEIAELKQENAALKQALATEQQATASQAQEIAALKQAAQSMDAQTAQMMQAMQAMMGAMQGELGELRRRVATLEAVGSAGAGVVVKPVKKEPA